MGLVLLLVGSVLVLALALIGLAVILTASAALGLATVAASRKLPLRARIALLSIIAVAPVTALVSTLDIGVAWQLAAAALPFLTTVASGAALLAFQTRKRRAPRITTPAWPIHHAPAAGH
ncbi:hypothetical protein [Streptomyces sp. NPDC089795]|uniref:hypothetical protein n=1 Tax=Streptomyces sp. NPDC089795 TaxID=3155297 RepID=UPI003416B2C7